MNERIRLTQFIKLSTTACLLLAVAAGIFLRFSYVTHLGIEGCDTFLYLWLGKMWHDGKFLLSDSDFLYLRPVFFALSGLAMKVFGVNDYSIKILNCTLDVLAGGVLFLLGRKTLGKNVLALIPVALYALLPKALYQSRIEDPHVSSTVFFLLATYGFLRWNEGGARRKFWFATSAFGASAASLIHGDLAMLGPLFVGLLYWHSFYRPDSPQTRYLAWSRLAPLFWFTVLFFLPYLLCVAYYGAPFLKGLAGEAGETYGHFDMKYAHLQGKWKLPYIFFKNFEVIDFLASGSARWAFLLALGLGYRAYRKGVRFPLAEMTPPFLAVGYVLLVTFLVKVYLFDSSMSRLFYPFIPLVFLSIVIFFRTALNKVPAQKSLLILFVLACALATHQMTKGRSLVAGVINKQPTYIRAAYDLLHDRVDANHKVLITPYISYLQRRGFQSFIYFGGNAVYVDKCVKTALPDFLALNQIRFIVFTPTRTHDWREMPSFHNGDCYGISTPHYSAEKELVKLEAYVASRKGRLIVQNETVGRVYELPPTLTTAIDHGTGE